MIRKITSPEVAGAAEAWVRLRAIRTLVDRGWVEYGGVWRWHHHVINLPDGVQRVLDRDEAYWWALGFADARRVGQEIKAVQAEVAPDIIPLSQIVEDYGENMHTARQLWRSGKLYRLWLKTRSVHIFRAQYVVLLESWAMSKGVLSQEQLARVPALIETWSRIQELIPALPDGVGEQAPIDLSAWQPPVIGAATGYDRNLQALSIGGTDHEGWFDYLACEDQRYRLRVSLDNDRDISRALPHDGVLAYVLGIGDGHGHGSLATYQQPPKAD